MGLFTVKIEKDVFDKLHAEHEVLKEQYEKLQKQYDSMSQKLDKVTKESKRKRKLEIYTERFFRTLKNLHDEGKFIGEDETHIFIDPKDFRAMLKSLGVDVQETLRVFRTLGFIKADKQSFTCTKRLNGKVKRVIAFDFRRHKVLCQLWRKV